MFAGLKLRNNLLACGALASLPALKRKILAVWIICLCVFATRELKAQTFAPIARGVELADFTRQIDGQPVRLKVLRLDLTKVRIDLASAGDAAVGTETTSSIAGRYNAIAAINAGFFRLDKSAFAGDAVGIVMTDGRLTSESERSRIGVAIANRRSRTTVDFGRFETTISLTRPDRRRSPTIINIDGINREAKPGEWVIYTRAFGAVAPALPVRGVRAAIVAGCDQSIRGGTLLSKCTQSSIRPSGTTVPSPIPRDGFVIMADESSPRTRDFFDIANPESPTGAQPFAVSLAMQVQVDGRLFPISKTMDIVAGVPQLVRNGKRDITWQSEKTNLAFVNTRHPRTAIAKLSDGKFIMLTADGRSESSGGIGLDSLADLLIELGAVDAINLDGGGSTTMVVRGKIVNQPSDREGERKVSSAFVVRLRAR